MIKNPGYNLILGRPLIFYLGLLTIVSFFITATIGYLIHSGRARINFRWHKIMAGISLSLALIHAAIGIAAYL